MQLLRSALILSHRYLGIPLSALFVVWFVSGIAMIYVGGMPELTTQERLAHLPPLDLAAVRVSAADAARSALGGTADSVLLETVEERPAYRLGNGPFGRTTVFADDGSVLAPLDVEQSRATAARFLSLAPGALEHVATLEQPDQWTLLLGRSLPLVKFRAHDAAGSEIYVSPDDADVALVTTARSRGLAWLATIPHWLYFTPLRSRQPLWYWTVVVASGLGCMLALLGLVLGVTQFRKSKPFSFAKSVRYRGWMRWHYVLGAVFGVFAFTWVFSGLLSMEPFAWTNATGLEAPSDTFSGGPLELERYATLAPAQAHALDPAEALKQLEYRRIGGAPYYLARFAAPAAAPARERLHQPYAIGGRAAPRQLLIDARTLAVRREPFDTAALVARLTAALPNETVAAQDLLTDYDAYYYSRAHEAPLPVLRVKFADPMRTWFYVDPALGELVAVIHRYNRLERWLYNGLHSLDFAFWYRRRPLWDIGMIVLIGGALATSSIGLVFGLRRLRRDVARAARALKRAGG